MRVERDFFGSVPGPAAVSDYLESPVGRQAFQDWFVAESTPSSSSFLREPDAAAAAVGGVTAIRGPSVEHSWDVLQFAQVVTRLVCMPECDALWLGGAFGVGRVFRSSHRGDTTTSGLLDLGSCSDSGSCSS